MEKLYIVLTVAALIGCVRQSLHGMEEGRSFQLHERFIAAVRSGDVEGVRAGIARGEDVNQMYNFRNEESLLEKAVAIKSYDVVKVLLEKGANAKHVDVYGETALHLAAGGGSSPITALLLTYGADMNVRNNGDYTPLMMTVRWDHVETAKVLLEAITRLTQIEKDSVKNWLLANHCLALEGQVSLPKDPRLCVARNIYRSLANDLRERVLRAGGRRALGMALGKSGGKKVPMVQLLRDYLDLAFLEEVARKQTLLPKQEKK